jgi:PIF1-like helicase
MILILRLFSCKDMPAQVKSFFIERFAITSSPGKDCFMRCIFWNSCSLLPGRTTSHSRFRMLLDTQSSIRNIRKGSQLTALIEKTALIIWDEVPMQHKYCFDAVSTTLADILGNEHPFGGIPVRYSLR